ncbi:MAG: TonB-dependent receptor [Acidobacteria bacterium]|nr:TonB-dependent receptor [Acidobacteriota bacterium]
MVVSPRLLLSLICLCPLLAFEDDTPTPARKDTIVVTGTYSPIPLEEADRSVRALPVRGEASLLANSVVDFLNLDSSVDMRQRGQSNIQTDVSIRGSTFGQTLILLNGLRLNDVQSGHHNLDVPVALDSLERVEVLKGSGSTLYGSDAVGGVVNLITKPPETSEFRLRGALGNFGSNQQRVSAAWVGSRISQQLSAYRDFSTGFMPNRDFRSLALSSTTGLESALGHTELVLGHADKPFGAEQFYGNFNSWERTKTWFASARQTFAQRTEAAFSFRRHTDLFVLYRDRPQVFTNRHAAESWQATVRRHEEFGSNARLHYGGEFLHDAIASNNLGNHTRARGAAYAAFDMRAASRFSFTLGIRDEVYASANHQVSPTAAAGVWLTPRLKLRGSLSRAFRLPTFTDLYYHDPANVGSPDLRPERAWSGEAGLDWNLGGNVRGELTYFQRRERDGIDYVRRSLTDIWRATNFQRLRFQGVEAALSLRAARTHLFDFRYTGLHGAQDQLAGAFSKYTFNYPTHSGIASWQSSLPAGLTARVRAGAVQRYARNVYGVADVYVARARGRVHPFLQLSNLTDTTYQEILGVAMPGRGFMAGIELVVFRAR